MGGKSATRHEAITTTNAHVRSGTLATKSPTENDETRCLAWLRSLARENIAGDDEPSRTREPKNAADLLPGERSEPGYPPPTRREPTRDSFPAPS
jgi:hypothetical protein